MRFLRLYTKLGRWKVDHDIKIINIKIDQANRDHSGTYHFEKETVKEIPINKELNKENKEWKDEFLLPYCV
jgi:uncharacterized membrane protein